MQGLAPLRPLKTLRGERVFTAAPVPLFGRRLKLTCSFEVLVSRAPGVRGASMACGRAQRTGARPAFSLPVAPDFPHFRWPPPAHELCCLVRRACAAPSGGPRAEPPV